MKRIFIYLALVNLLDATVTFWGLHYSFIGERNLLMAALYQSNPLNFLVVKVVLSCFLMAFIIFKKLPTRSLIKKLAVTASIVYTFVCIYHSVWITEVFTYQYIGLIYL